MGRETRKGGDYYYRKRRVGGRVVSEYVGGGVIALLAEQYDQRERERREREQAKERAEIEAMKAEDAALDALLDQVAEAVNASLLSLGYHQHKGTWRKIRYETKGKPERKDCLETGRRTRRAD